MNLLYKYYSIDEHRYSILNLRNSVVVYNSLFTFNDPFEGIGQIIYNREQPDNEFWEAVESNIITDRKNELILNYRIFCTTEHYDNALMWAHYADKHTGFCVGYKKEDIENISTKLHRVTYTSQPYNLKMKSDESILFIKSNEWEYENEWRAIYKLSEGDITHLDPNVGNPDYKNKLYIPHINRETHKPEMLTSEIRIMKYCPPQVVYLGLRAGLGDKDQITDICRNLNIPIFQMSQVHNSFSLIAQSI